MIQRDQLCRGKQLISIRFNLVHSIIVKFSFDSLEQRIENEN